MIPEDRLKKVNKNAVIFYQCYFSFHCTLPSRYDASICIYKLRIIYQREFIVSTCVHFSY